MGQVFLTAAVLATVIGSPAVGNDAREAPVFSGITHQFAENAGAGDATPDETTTPSDSELIGAIVKDMDDADTAGFDELKQWPAELRACLAKAENSCVPRAGAWGYVAPNYTSTCREGIRQRCRREAAETKEQVAKGVTLRSSNIVFRVLRKGNFEGNIIAYLSYRQRGSDLLSQLKATFRLSRGVLRLVESRDVQ